MSTFYPYYVLLTKNAKAQGVTAVGYSKLLEKPAVQRNAVPVPQETMNQTGSFPSRAVTQSFSMSLDRLAVYGLADSETASLKANQFVEAIIPSPTEETLKANFYPEEYGSLYYTSSTFTTNSFGPLDHYSGSDADGIFNDISEYPANRGFWNYRLQSHGVTAGPPDYPNPATNNQGWDTLPLYKKQEIGNWHLWFHTLPSESRYKNHTDTNGSSSLYGAATYMTMSGDFTELNSVGRDQNYNEMNPNLENYTKVGQSLTGKNVDILIFEGTRESPYNGHFDTTHPDFFGTDGNTRIQFIDWRDYGDTVMSPFYYFPKAQPLNASSTRPVGATLHRQMCGSTAGGLLNGFGYGADLYFFPASTLQVFTQAAVLGPSLGWTMPYNLNVVKNFHLNKPINPKTGRQNPTILNISMRGFYQYPYMTYEMGSKSSASFVVPMEEGKGFRITNTYEDSIFIYKNGGHNNPDNHPGPNGLGAFRPMINKMNGPWAKKVAALYYYSGSDISGVVNHINKSGSQTGFDDSEYTVLNTLYTCSANLATNTLHITSSTDYVVSRDRIYTGSEHDFYNMSGHPNPGGGEYITQLTGGFDPDTHIHKIVVKGQIVQTGSSLYPNASHGPGFERLRPRDQYGIDRGLHGSFNAITSGYRTVTSTSTSSGEFSNPSGTGVRWISAQFITNAQSCTLPSGFTTEDFPHTVLNELFEELADAGVITCIAAGNDFHSTTTRTSSFNDEYFDEANYDDDLYNSWVQYDSNIENLIIDDTSFAQFNAQTNWLTKVSHSTEVRYGGTNLVDNGSAILVGALGNDAHGNWNSWYGRASSTEYDNIPGFEGTINGTYVTDNPLTNSIAAGIFPSDYSQKGAGVDVYCAGFHSSMAGMPATSPPGSIYMGLQESMALTHSFYTDYYEKEYGITFNTQSLIDAYSQPHNSHAYYLDNFNFFYSKESSTNPNADPNLPKWYPSGHSVNTQRGGTSNATPRLVGMIACYLEAHPDANLKDVRKWIQKNSFSIPTCHDPDRPRFLLENSWDMIDTPNSGAFYTNHLFMSGGDWGPDPRIMTFPYSQFNPSKFEGSITMDGIDFSL